MIKQKSSKYLVNKDFSSILLNILRAISIGKQSIVQIYSQIIKLLIINNNAYIEYIQ